MADEMADEKVGGPPYKVAIVAPTCFYYQVPLFRELADHPNIDLTVYYCSDEPLRGEDVFRTFKTDRNWGLEEEELLRGYKYKFLHNFSPRPSYLRWPFGLMNLGIWNEIRKQRPDSVVLMSWTNLTWWLAILACVFFKIPYFYMTDANVLSELPKRKWWRFLKKATLGKFVFRHASGFLCAGTANQELYRYYGVPDEKFVSFAYSWGYQSLLDGSAALKDRKFQLRAELGIPPDKWVILFCGRFSEEKSPADLLHAYWRVGSPDCALIFVGDGELKPHLEAQTARYGLGSVYFCGFQDRRELPKYYAISDVLVLPSRRETWGMVVNEAMCFGLPVIVSDQVGSGIDLVQDGYNGFAFPHANVEALASRIQQFMQLPEAEKERYGTRSKKLIKEWTDRDLAQSLCQYLELIINRRRANGRHPASTGH